jgi:hypothetical protein
VGSLRHWLCLVFLACLLAVVAVPAAAKVSTAQTLTFRTGPFVVNCTSTGQLCSPPERLRFRLRHRGTLTSIRYTTAATHCSAVKLHVLLYGHQVATTGKLPAGQSTEVLSTAIALPRGVIRLGFKAQGFVGGCNSGQLGSWGGKITVTVKIPPH